MLYIKIVFMFYLLSVLSCEAPNSFERNNPHDPKSKYFQPNNPSALSAIPINESQVQIQWKDSSNFEDGYILSRKENNQKYCRIALLESNTQIFFDNINLKHGNKYSYSVTAYHDTNESEMIETSFNYTIKPPTNLNIKNHGLYSALLSWDLDSPTEFIKQIIIERKSRLDTSYQSVAILDSNTNEYIISLEDTSQNYSIRIKTLSSEYSEVVDLGCENQVVKEKVIKRGYGISSVDISPDERFIAFGERSYVYVIDIQTEEEILRLPIEYAEVRFSPDSRYLLVGKSWDNPGSAKLYNLENGELLYDFKDTQGMVDYNSDGKSIIAASNSDPSIKVFSTADGGLLKKFNNINPTNIIVFSEDGNHIAVDNQSYFEIYNVSTTQRIFKHNYYGVTLNCGAFSHDNNLYASGTQYNIHFRDMKTGSLIYSSKATRTMTNSKIAFTYDDMYVVSGGYFGCAIFSAEDGSLVHDLYPSQADGVIHAVTTSNNSNIFVTNEGGKVIIWSYNIGWKKL